MRLRVRRGLRHDDMGMNVDRCRRWTPGAAIGVVDASGGEAIAILGVDHCWGPVVDLILWDTLAAYRLDGRWGQRLETVVASVSPRPAASASSKQANALAATGS